MTPLTEIILASYTLADLNEQQFHLEQLGNSEIAGWIVLGFKHSKQSEIH